MFRGLPGTVNQGLPYHLCTRVLVGLFKFNRLDVLRQAKIPATHLVRIAMSTSKNTSGGRWVYCRSIRKNGRVIYPKNGKFFRFWVDGKK